MLRFAALSLAFFVTLSCTPRDFHTAHTKDAWNAENSPNQFGASMKRTYKALSKQARLAREPWSDTYWPSSQGGIAARWLNPADDAWSYKTHPKEELLAMGSAAIRLLSPAEKFDIFMGRYDYPTVKAERERVKPSDAGWEGLCHAWTPASLLFEEPNPITLKNPDGIAIPFGASDIKALLIYALHHNPDATRTLFAGTRCNEDGPVVGTGSQEACKDLNAGAFHVILANMIAKEKTGFTIDVTRESQVWNQPVFGFRTEEVSTRKGKSPGAANGTESEVELRTTVEYGLEISPEWEPAIKSGRNNTTTVEYRYRLELDGKGDVIGGEWLSDERPDFAWAASGKLDLATLSGPGGVSFAGVKEIWSKSLSAATTDEPPAYPTPRPPATSCEGLPRLKCLTSWPACRWRVEGPWFSGRCVAR